MTKKQLASQSLAKMQQYHQTVSPKQEFERMVTQGVINREGEVLIGKNESKHSSDQQNTAK